MHHGKSLSPEDLEALRRFDSCTLANAIEVLNIRPRNEGYIQDTVSCVFPKLPPVAGYAVVGKMRSASPPVEGHWYYDHIDWWRYVASVPPPRIIVLLDADSPPGTGALFGELHARICMALNCVCCITNGKVRDLPAIGQLGFQLFSAGLSVSHAYAHVVDFGHPIEIGGLRIHSGDLLHGDLHGVQLVPPEFATKLPEIATQVLREEQTFIQVCLDGNFSIERLAKAIREHAEGRPCKSK
jgi:4-hydroxy-4-methyl-2-oxoglutarate aldolase